MQMKQYYQKWKHTLASNAKRNRSETTEEEQFQCDFLIEAYFFRVHQRVLCFFDRGGTVSSLRNGIEFSKTLVHLVGTQDKVHTSVQSSLASCLQLRPLCGCIDLSYLKATNMVYMIAK